MTPTNCPLCQSSDINAYEVGWSTIHCRNCRLSLSRGIPLDDLVRIWNARGEQVEFLLAALLVRPRVLEPARTSEQVGLFSVPE